MPDLNRCRRAAYSALACCSMLATVSQAGLLADSTRVIYHAQAREKSVIVANTNPYALFSQVWIDDGSNQLEFAAPAFVVLPAVFKMSPHEVKALRIIYNGLPLPQDRESVYWLNLYEIPAISSDQLQHNHLNMAMNTQIKIFYRPKALKPMSIDAISAGLVFQILDPQQQTQTHSAMMRVTNPSPYHVTVLSLALSSPSQQRELSSKYNMIAPYSYTDFVLPQADFSIKQKLKLRYQLIDDQGKSHMFERRIALELQPLASMP